MQKSISATVLLSIALFLNSCKNNSKSGFDTDNIIGLWMIDQYEINGTVLRHESIGSPRIEFRGNEYLINTAGDVEKGVYTISDSTLKLDCTSNPDKPDNVFTITRLDSALAEYHSVTDNNRLNVTIRKINP
jgi:hypothetical protein